MRDVSVSAREFDALFQALRTWGRWGTDDQRGALHLLSPEAVVAATRLVREGLSVTLSLPLNTDPAVHNPMPADHHMTMFGEAPVATGPLHFKKDYIGLDSTTTATHTLTRCATSPTRARSTTTGPKTR